jgi:hypothetical protein
MLAEVIDFVRALDTHVARCARRLHSEPELDADGGQSLYDALPREVQRAFVTLARLTREANAWPSAALLTSVARLHKADEGAVLCLMGWIPRRRCLTDIERRCLELSKQITLGLSM